MWIVDVLVVETLKKLQIFSMEFAAFYLSACGALEG